MLVTLITPTGGRPEAFSLCEKYMGRQTYKGAKQWIVVDDCNPPTKCTLGQEYIRGPMLWEPTINTQRPNLDAALKQTKGDIILIIEDDDWYHPQYIERMVQLLSFASIVGEGNAKYYNVSAQGYKELHNVRHSSLCNTALRRELLPKLFSAVHSGELYFDINLWEKLIDEREKRILLFDHNYVVGLKGMPGRLGIGIGHKQKDYSFDPEWRKLKEWIGEEDAKMYFQFSKASKPKPSTVFLTKQSLGGKPYAINQERQKNNESNDKAVRKEERKEGLLRQPQQRNNLRSGPFIQQR